MSERAKVMSYEDTEGLQAQIATKEVKRGKSKRGPKLDIVADGINGFELFLEPELARMVDAPHLGIEPVVRMC